MNREAQARGVFLLMLRQAWLVFGWYCWSRSVAWFGYPNLIVSVKGKIFNFVVISRLVVLLSYLISNTTVNQRLRLKTTDKVITAARKIPARLITS